VKVKRKGFFERLFGSRRDAREPDAQVAETTDERDEMIRGVEELPEILVKEVMVPRIDVVFLPLDAPRDEVVGRFIESGHSRIPVYKETIDDVVGVLYAKDLMKAMTVAGEFDIPSLVRQPFFVPETKRIDTLLREFRRKRVHIAIVVDEYGGTSGIVSLEDIIEEIVGEIQDEFDDEREDVVKLGDGIFLCDARVDIEDLNEAIGLDLPDRGYDTLGGFVFDLFGKIPAKFEKITWGGVDFIVQDMDAHRIDSVKIVTRGKE
jgi:CBS domain containing-hemolysin-like protein